MALAKLQSVTGITSPPTPLTSGSPRQSLPKTIGRNPGAPARARGAGAGRGRGPRARGAGVRRGRGHASDATNRVRRANDDRQTTRQGERRARASDNGTSETGERL